MKTLKYVNPEMRATLGFPFQNGRFVKPDRAGAVMSPSAVWRRCSSGDRISSRREAARCFRRTLGRWMKRNSYILKTISQCIEIKNSEV